MMIAPREIYQADFYSSPIRSLAPKGMLAVEIESKTSSREVTAHLQAYDPTSDGWFDLWEQSSPATTSFSETFIDMNYLFPPSDIHKIFLTPEMRVWFEFSGTGLMVLSAHWFDALSTRQSA